MTRPKRPSPGLYNTGGTAMRLPTADLFAIGPAAPGPALRRGALLTVPVAATLLIELGFSAPTHGALATGAWMAGFVGMDAPARTRAGWQAAVAPVIGIAAAIGILSSQVAVLAVVAIGLLGLAAGYCFAVSLRLAVCGLIAVLALVIAQGLLLPVADAPKALLWGTAGALTQPLWSLIVWVAFDREEEQGGGLDLRRAMGRIRADLDIGSHVARHAIRFGVSLAIGVAVYRALGLEEHGYWIPLTVLFVMRPEREESYRRLVLRAVGTAAGLVLATAAAEAIDSEFLDGIVIVVAAAAAYGTLTVQYAAFTATITIYIAVLFDTLGEAALDADGQLALGTAIGLAIIYLAFVLWPNREEALDLAKQPNGP